MNKAELKKSLIDNLKKSVPYDNDKGGQTVGIVPSNVCLKCEELDIIIIIGYHKSQLKNMELAYVLMDLAIDELLI